MDPMTILALGEGILKLSTSAFAVFRQVAADAGADTATLAALDQKYDAAIQHERDVAAGTTDPGH